MELINKSMAVNFRKCRMFCKSGWIYLIALCLLYFVLAVDAQQHRMNQRSGFDQFNRWQFRPQSSIRPANLQSPVASANRRQQRLRLLMRQRQHINNKIERQNAELEREFSARRNTGNNAGGIDNIYNSNLNNANTRGRGTQQTRVQQRNWRANTPNAGRRNTATGVNNMVPNSRNGINNNRNNHDRRAVPNNINRSIRNNRVRNFNQNRNNNVDNLFQRRGQSRVQTDVSTNRAFQRNVGRSNRPVRQRPRAGTNFNQQVLQTRSSARDHSSTTGSRRGWGRNINPATGAGHRGLPRSHINTQRSNNQRQRNRVLPSQIPPSSSTSYRTSSLTNRRDISTNPRVSPRRGNLHVQAKSNVQQNPNPQEANTRRSFRTNRRSHSGRTVPIHVSPRPTQISRLTQTQPFTNSISNTHGSPKKIVLIRNRNGTFRRASKTVQNALAGRTTVKRVNAQVPSPTRRSAIKNPVRQILMPLPSVVPQTNGRRGNTHVITRLRAPIPAAARPSNELTRINAASALSGAAPQPSVVPQSNVVKPIHEILQSLLPQSNAVQNGNTLTHTATAQTGGSQPASGIQQTVAAIQAVNSAFVPNHVQTVNSAFVPNQVQTVNSAFVQNPVQTVNSAFVPNPVQAVNSALAPNPWVSAPRSASVSNISPFSGLVSGGLGSTLGTGLSGMGLWDGSSNGIPLQMSMLGISHGSQLNPMMQQMMFGDTIDPPDPPDPTPKPGQAAAAVEAEDMPSTTAQPVTSTTLPNTTASTASSLPQTTTNSSNVYGIAKQILSLFGESGIAGKLRVEPVIVTMTPSELTTPASVTLAPLKQNVLTPAPSKEVKVAPIMKSRFETGKMLKLNVEPIKGENRAQHKGANDQLKVENTAKLQDLFIGGRHKKQESTSVKTLKVQPIPSGLQQISVLNNVERKLVMSPFDASQGLRGVSARRIPTEITTRATRPTLPMVATPAPGSTPDHHSVVHDLLESIKIIWDSHATPIPPPPKVLMPRATVPPMTPQPRFTSPSITTTTPTPTTTTTTTTLPPVTTTTTTTTLSPTTKVQFTCTPQSPTFACKGKDLFGAIKSMAAWCMGMCLKGSCVDTVCVCGCNFPDGVKQTKSSVGSPDLKANQPWGIRKLRNKGSQKRKNNRNKQKHWKKTTTVTPPTTEEPPEVEEIEAEDMPSTTTTTAPETTTLMDFAIVTSPIFDVTITPHKTTVASPPKNMQLRQMQHKHVHEQNIDSSNKHVALIPALDWGSKSKVKALFAKMAKNAGHAAKSSTPPMPTEASTPPAPIEEWNKIDTSSTPRPVAGWNRQDSINTVAPKQWNQQTRTTTPPPFDSVTTKRPPPSWTGTRWGLKLPPPKPSVKSQARDRPEGRPPRTREWARGARNGDTTSRWRDQEPTTWEEPPRDRWRDTPPRSQDRRWRDPSPTPWEEPGRGRDRWGTSARWNGGSRSTWRQPARGSGGRGGWRNPPPLSETGPRNAWRQGDSTFRERNTSDGGGTRRRFRLRKKWRRTSTPAAEEGEEAEAAEGADR